jgi:hypothetical protein
MAFEEGEACSVFRSTIDERVWMCNIPYVDVATGLVASTSLRRVKAYVEQLADRQLDYGNGRWIQDLDEGGWSYYPES